MGMESLFSLSRLWDWFGRWRRISELRTTAQSNGWTYVKQDAGLLDMSARFPFDMGKYKMQTRGLQAVGLRDLVRRAQHSVRGTTDGMPFGAFEYNFTVWEETDNIPLPRTDHYVIAWVATPPSQRWLEVHRLEDSLTNKLARATVGLGDIQLESDAFNRRFKVDTDDSRFAYDVLNPRVMQDMLIEHRQWRPLRFENSIVMTWEHREIGADAIDPLVDFLVDKVRRVPEYAWGKR